MDFNSTIDLIIKDLEETREIIDDLKRYQGVPEFQVELAKAKCKSAADVISFLKTMKEPLPAKAGKEEVTHKHTQDKDVIIIDKLPEQKRIHVEVTDKEPVHEHNKSEKHVTVQPEVKKELPKAPEKKAEGTTIFADTFSQPSDRVNEQRGVILSDQGTHISQPLSNLSDAIGVNDKFLFIREIFNGDSGEYINAISKLNEVTSLSDAKAIIMSYTGNNKENEAISQLLGLVKRKLPSDE